MIPEQSLHSAEAVFRCAKQQKAAEVAALAEQRGRAAELTALQNQPKKVEVSFSEAEHKLQAEKQAQEQAEHITERKSDRRFQLTTALLGAVAGALFTLLVEHFGAVINGILHLTPNLKQWLLQLIQG